MKTTTKTQRTRHRNPKKTIADLKNAAVRILKTKGITQLSTRQLLAELDVSSGALFHHFPTKNHLIAAALEEIFNELTERIRSLSKKACSGQCSKIEVVEGMYDTIIDSVFYGLMEVAMTVRSEPELAKLIAPSVKHWRQVLADFWNDTFFLSDFNKKDSDIHWVMATNMLRGQALASSFGSSPIDRKEFCVYFSELMLSKAIIRKIM